MEFEKRTAGHIHNEYPADATWRATSCGQIQHVSRREFSKRECKQLSESGDLRVAPRAEVKAYFSTSNSVCLEITAKVNEVNAKGNRTWEQVMEKSSMSEHLIA